MGKASGWEARRACVVKHAQRDAGWARRWTGPRGVRAPSQVERHGGWKRQPAELLAAEADGLHGPWQWSSLC
eukprot:9083204-Pyramimonas_sp.AAC.2